MKVNNLIKLLIVVFTVLAGVNIFFTAMSYSVILSLISAILLALASVTGTIFIFRQVKAAKAQEQVAQMREKVLFEKWQAVYTASPIGVCFLDKDFKMLDCNDALYKMMQCDSREEYINRHRDFWTEYQPGGRTSVEEIKVAYEKVFAVGQYNSIWTCQNSEGEEFPVDIIMIPVKDGDEVVIAIHVIDLRPFRAAEKESRTKTMFLARMSHELRTPMNAVLGITEIELRKGEHSPETEEAFLRIYSSSSLLLAIINDILDLSKVETGKMEILPAKYEVASMIVDTVQLNLMHIGSRQIKFALNVDEQLPGYLIGDELRIKQILNNLLSNAFKYTKEGQVTLSFGVEKTEADLGKNAAETGKQTQELTLVVCVQDTGMGMSKEQIDSLFEIEFTRFNIQSNRAIEGSGLGMMISYQLITLMNGGITVESELGKGTSITVRIPQISFGAEVLGSKNVENLQNLEVTQKSLKKMAKLDFKPMPHGRVLVVDDVESNLYVAKGFLLPYKINIDTAVSGYDAVEKIKAGEVYDIIFMDHMMPGMDGIEAAKIIRETGYDYPVIALTANTFKGSSEMFIENGFTEFISKPIDLIVFDACLRRYIKDKQNPKMIEKTQHKPDNTGGEVKGQAEPDDFAAGLVKAFLIDARKAVDILEPLIQARRFDEDTIKTFVIQVHAMKSALHNIGYSSLAEAALKLELAGKKADIEVINSEAPQFVDSIKEIINEIQ